MKTSELITALQFEQKTHGDLDIHFAGGDEYEITGVQHVAAKTSIHHGSVTGSHLFRPERLVITGKSIQ